MCTWLDGLQIWSVSDEGLRGYCVVIVKKERKKRERRGQVFWVLFTTRYLATCAGWQQIGNTVFALYLRISKDLSISLIRSLKKYEIYHKLVMGKKIPIRDFGLRKNIGNWSEKQSFGLWLRLVKNLQPC